MELLWTRFIKIANGECLNEINQGFLIKSGLYQCVGAVDGCHIPIIPPERFLC